MPLQQRDSLRRTIGHPWVVFVLGRRSVNDTIDHMHRSQSTMQRQRFPRISFCILGSTKRLAVGLFLIRWARGISSLRLYVGFVDADRLFG